MATRATGKVTRLYIRREAANIRLELPDGTELPKDNYFTLWLTHENFHALYSLALSAAVNGYPLTIRTESEISATEPARVEYLVVDW